MKMHLVTLATEFSWIHNISRMSSKMNTIVLTFQIILIVLDLVLNSVTPYLKGDKLLISFLFM